MTDESAAAWCEVGEVELSKLVEPRLQLHWALQTVMVFADSALERLPDDSQSNFEWRDDFEALVGRQRPDGLAAGLRIADMTLLVFDGSGAIAEGVSLERRTLDGAMAWLEETVEALTDARPGRAIHIRDYEMPAHPVADGAVFEIEDPTAYAELGLWFADGNLVLHRLEPSGEGWGEVRCWPHHFDLGTLTQISPPLKSIGVGLSPGDYSYPEPYFYVNPYGLEDPPQDPPSLEHGGHWHTEGWFGAVLTATSILEGREDSQEKSVASFLHSGVRASEELLEASGA
jgi:hypothetical protein